MTRDEFKEFWRELTRLYPFDFKSEASVVEWAEALREAPFEPAMRALRKYREGELKCQPVGRKWPAPSARDIAEDAILYNGVGKLMWWAIHGQAKDV